MRADDLESAKRIFDQAVDMPEQDRDAFIGRACADNATLRDAVQRLLAEFQSDASKWNDDLRILTPPAHPQLGNDTALVIGKTISHYRVLEIIGKGGFGVVYKAKDTKLGRLVALKLLPAEVARDPLALERFRREASTASALNHPHVCTIHDIDQDQGQHFIVMELLHGKTLKQRLLDGPMTTEAVLKFGLQIASALEAVHAKGIIHRDIKPANIFITSEGQAKLLDFGVAKLSSTRAAATNRGFLLSRESDVTDLTSTGAMLGTLAYMSPEQTRGEELDGQTDLFSFGVVLYEMITGQPAFSGSAAGVIIDAILNRTPASVSSVNPAVPRRIVEIIDKALQKDLKNRYQSASDLRSDLLTCDIAIPATPTARTRGRRYWLGSIVGILVLTAVLIPTWTFRRVPGRDGAPLPPLIAVRDLRNLSPENAQSYFAAGMTEEIQGQLSKISALRLLSREAVEKYRNTGVNQMAADLGVRSIVDGSVRLDGNRVRISVELVDASDHHTQWSDQYERDLSDVFAVQTDVALQIAHALQANLSPTEHQLLGKRPTENVEAYDLYLKAMKTPNPAGMKLLEQALQLDPRFAVAKAALAYRTFGLGYTEGAQPVDRAMAQVREALEIDPTLAYGHHVLGSAYILKGIDAQARLAFMRALELDPNYVPAMQNLSINEVQYGRLDDSLTWARRSFALSAHTGNDYYHVGVPLVLLRDDAVTMRWLSHGERRDPPSPRVQTHLALTEMLRGDDTAALSYIHRAAERWPRSVEVTGALAELAFLVGSDDGDAITEQLYQRFPDMVSVFDGESLRARRAYFLKRRGDPRATSLADDVLRPAREQLAAGNQMPNLSLDMAAAFMIRGERDAVLEWLEAAVKRGYRNYGALSRDPIFAPLAREPRFRALIQQMTTDVARQRQRALDRGLLDLSSLDPGMK